MKFRTVLLIVAAVVVMPTCLLAHAFLDHAEPEVGSRVTAPPKVVRVWFTDEIDPRQSGLEVTDADGRRVDKCDCCVDAKDDTLMIVSVAELPPGTYRVKWHCACLDSHRTQGDFKFTVK